MQKVVVGLILFCIVLLGIRLATFYAANVTIKDGQMLSFESTIGSGKQRGSLIYYTVLYRKRIPVTFVTKFTQQLDFGTNVAISGSVRESRSSNSLLYTLQFPKITVIKPAGGLTIVTNALRERITLFYDQTLPPVGSALVSGIVFGEKHSMPKAFEDSLKQTGVMHVIAASGMNVSLVAGSVLTLFGGLVKRRLAVLLTLAVIVLYTFLAGLQPSIIRASLMGSIAFGATLLGRQYTALFALFLTGFMMLFVSPQLLSDIGFQLSFLATAGILLIKPLFDRVFSKRSRIIRSLWGDLGTTFSAQLATMPILLGTFSSYGLLSVFANMLVLWVVPFILVGGMIAGIVALIFVPLAKLFLYLLLPFLLYFEQVISWFGSFDLTVNFERIPGAIILGYYCLLFAVVWMLQSKNHR